MTPLPPSLRDEVEKGPRAVYIPFGAFLKIHPFWRCGASLKMKCQILLMEKNNTYGYV